MGIDRRQWALPWSGALVYPGFIYAFRWALDGYEASGGVLWAAGALLIMLVAMLVPVLAIRSLMITRHEQARPDQRVALVRGVLCLAFAVPSFFSLMFSLARLADVYESLVAIWVVVWLALGALLYLRGGQRTVAFKEAGSIARLRVIHGVTALLLLCGFLIAHLINHDLAAWSISLQSAAMTWLRQWYRSDWVEPVLLAMVLVMICTGIPMVAHHARWRLDGFRVVQLATGVYLGVFLCSHVFATLNARRLGIETDWTFAAGPISLLEQSGMTVRLIPHYFYSTLAAIVHVGCGLRVVLLQHGGTKLLGNRAFVAMASIAAVITALSTAALLGFHAVRG